MKNKYNLPEYLENSLYSPYKPNPLRFGATALIEPPLIRTLKIKHWNELDEDIADKLWMIHGNAVDALVKRHSRFGLCNLKFERVWCKDKEGRDIVVVIKPDYYNVLTHELADVKDTSVWTIINGKLEYEQQVNIYDFVMHLECPGLPISGLSLHLFPKDWKKNDKLRFGRDYPPIPFKVVPQKRWSRQEQRTFIDEHIQDHLENSMRECTAREKWATNAQWAAKKRANKTAKGGKVCDSEQQALAFITKKSGGTPNMKIWEIQFRPATCKRCDSYCSVNSFCPFYNKRK